MSTPYAPTLLYPNGGEQIFAAETVISWEISSNNDPNAVSYEIYFTELFDPFKEPDWIQLAVVPGNVSQYVWQNGVTLHSSTCRISIRARANNGERSLFFVSAANFSVYCKKLATPIILSPTPGSYDQYISILTDDSGLTDSGSQQSLYQFYYSSDNLSIPNTVIAENVPPGTSITWETINLLPSNDYVFSAYLADNDGNTSDVAIVSGVTISHEGFFLIDTQPPVAGVTINNNAVFTTQQNVNVEVVAYDATTAIQSMLLQEPGGNQTNPSPFINVQSFTLSASNAIKTVEIVAQDFAANRLGGTNQRTFEVMLDSSSSIVDLTVDNNNYVWFVTNGETNSLYKVQNFASLVLTVVEQPTAVQAFGSFIYIATVTSNGFGKIYQYDGMNLNTLITFSDNDSLINSTVVYQNQMYLGAENGLIYQFDGANFTTLNGTGNPISEMVSDGNLLYLSEKYSKNLYVFDGNSFINTIQ